MYLRKCSFRSNCLYVTVWKTEDPAQSCKLKASYIDIKNATLLLSCSLKALFLLVQLFITVVFGYMHVLYVCIYALVLGILFYASTCCKL